jgi:hypothetical protein
MGISEGKVEVVEGEARSSRRRGAGFGVVEGEPHSSRRRGAVYGVVEVKRRRGG